jgi:hypothetical protein
MSGRSRRALARVHRTRHQLLPGSGLAQNEDRRVGARDQPDLLERRRERAALPDDLLDVVRRADLLAQVLVLHGEPAQVLLGALALVDVAQDQRIELAAADLDMRQGGLDRELAAVGTAGAETARRPDVGALPTPVEGRHRPLQRLAEALGEEAVDRRADGLGRGAAKDLLGGLVEECHLARAVEGDDGIHRRVKDASQPFLALLERLLGALALGDVYVRGAGGLDLALRIPYRTDVEADPELGAVPAPCLDLLADRRQPVEEPLVRSARGFPSGVSA